MSTDDSNENVSHQQQYSQQQYGGYPPQGPLPNEDRDGSSVSSSDKEDVEEARKEYEEAYEDTYGSD